MTQKQNKKQKMFVILDNFPEITFSWYIHFSVCFKENCKTCCFLKYTRMYVGLRCLDWLEWKKHIDMCEVHSMNLPFYEMDAFFYLDDILIILLFVLF